MDKKELKKAVENGSRGGKKTLEMHGKAHFAKAAHERWKKWHKLRAAKGVA